MKPEQKWQHVAYAFPNRDWQNLMLLCLPRLWVDAEALKNRPTAYDPTAARSRLNVTTVDMDDPFKERHFVFEVDGHKSPRLAGDALSVWVCIEWPELFRLGE